RCGRRDDELIFQDSARLPSLAEVLQQALAAELREDVNRINPRINEIAEDKIDDAVFAPKGHRGLRPFLRQRIEPGTFTSGEDESEHAQSHWQGHCGSCAAKSATGLQTFPVVYVPGSRGGPSAAGVIRYWRYEEMDFRSCAGRRLHGW